MLPASAKPRVELRDLVDLPEEAAPRVVLLEPDDVLAGLYRWHLERAEAEVCRAEGVAEAMAQLAGTGAHAAIVNADAVDFAKTVARLRTANPAVRIVAVTAARDPSSDLLAAGANEHLAREASRPWEVAGAALRDLETNNYQ